LHPAPKPRFFAETLTVTAGNWLRTSSTVSSVEPLSTTIASTPSGSDARQAAIVDADW
jgi:hypothetical protein